MEVFVLCCWAAQQLVSFKMYFYSLMKHLCISLYKLVRILAQCPSEVIITTAPEETPVCQALCGCLSDIEFMSKAGKASSGQRERRGWERERLAQSEEET